MCAHVKKVYEALNKSVPHSRGRANVKIYFYYVGLKVYYRIHILEVAGLYQLVTVLCSCDQMVPSSQLVVLGISFC